MRRTAIIETALFLLVSLTTMTCCCQSAAAYSLDIKAWIDGESQLIIKGNTVQWHNLLYNAPGYEGHDGHPVPTYLATKAMGTVAWTPTGWSNGTSGDTTSGKFKSLNPPLPAEDQTVTLEVIQKRPTNSVTIVQQPAATNDYTLIVDFNDAVPWAGGAYWYEVRLWYQYDLVIQGGGNGSGAVDADGIICTVTDGSGDCTLTDLEGAPFTLTAIPDPGSVFTGWTGGGCPATGPCELTLTGNTTITATFTNASTFTKVTMVSPNGKEKLPSGEGWDLIWGGPPEVTSYKLLCSLDNGITWKTITTDTGTTTSWTVQTVGKNTNTCLTKVIGYNGTTKVGADKSDRPFTIEVVRLTYPNGGELSFGESPFSSDQGITITWTTHEPINPVDQVQLFFTLDNGVTWKKFGSQPDPGSNPGSWPVMLPHVTNPKPNCRVKVVLYVSGKKVGSDVSDRVFQIIP